MDIADLLTSAGINIALAILFLTLFSLFNKQTGNAGVYFPRDLLRDWRNTIADRKRPTLASFIPSAGWVLRAWRTTEQDILESTGLDAVVFLRIFLFSLKLFGICAFIGLFILLPTSFTVEIQDTHEWTHKSFDRFLITNIEGGSKRFWIHFITVYVLSFLIYFLLYEEYVTITKMRLEYHFQVHHKADQFSVLVRAIPSDPNGKTFTDTVKEFFSEFHEHTYLCHQMVYRLPTIEKMISKLEILEKEIDYLKYLPASKRHVRRDGFCGLYGERKDPIEMKVQEVEDLYCSIREGQDNVLRDKKEISAAIVSFKSRWGAAVAAQSQLAEDPLSWTTEWAPEPRDVSWQNLAMSTKQLWLRHVVAAAVTFAITIFYCVPSTIIVAINSINDLKQFWPDKLTFILELPGVEQFVSGYLSTVLLAALLWMIPPMLLCLSGLEGYTSRSTQEREATKKFFYFLAGPIFFIQVLGGGAVGVAREWEFIKNPADIPFRLASAIPGQATFFMSYIMTSGWAGFPLEILNIGTLFVNFFKRHTLNDDSEEPELEVYALQYYRTIPNLLLFIFVGIVYAVIAPLLPPFLVVYFGLGYIVFKNQIIHVYEPAYETGGKIWPLVHNRILAGLGIMQLTFVGIFQTKMGKNMSVATLPLPVLTYMFHHYCKARFLPVYDNVSIESAKLRDRKDESLGQLDDVRDVVTDAYTHPGLKPVDISKYGRSEGYRLL